MNLELRESDIKTFKSKVKGKVNLEWRNSVYMVRPFTFNDDAIPPSPDFDCGLF